MVTLKRIREDFAHRFVGLAVVLAATSTVNAGVWNVNSGGSIANIGYTNFTFTVTGEPPSVGDVDIRIAASYENLDDPIFRLFSPAGTELLLMARPGPPSAGNWQDTYLDDEASVDIGIAPHNQPPWAGPEWNGISYRPTFNTNQLSVFDGENPNGTWRLEIHDPFFSYGGTLFTAGDAAPWGTAIGTQLIITPEPAALSLLALGSLGLLRRQRKA